jgi:FkbM family methyltransferase
MEAVVDDTASNQSFLLELVKRLDESSDAEVSELLAGVIDRLRADAIGALMDKLPPTRPLDYAPHPIRLLVSSSEIGVRLLSVEKEPFTVAWIERSIGPGDVFYDIGANVGAYSLIAAKATAGRARVLAFEPAAASFHDLCRNVALNGCAESVVPLPIALWSASAGLALTTGPPVAGAARHEISRRPTPGEGDSAPVLGIPLDDLVERFGFPPPTHAKIDTDGYELEVLQGAAQTLARPGWRSLIVELDRGQTRRNRQITRLLADAGFTSSREHARGPSPRFPNPEGRDVYWTFSRPEPQARRPARPRLRPSTRSHTSPVRAAQRRAVTATLAAITCLFLLFVLLPEQLGDRPYDVFGLRF